MTKTTKEEIGGCGAVYYPDLSYGVQNYKISRLREILNLESWSRPDLQSESTWGPQDEGRTVCPFRTDFFLPHSAFAIHRFSELVDSTLARAPLRTFTRARTSYSLQSLLKSPAINGAAV